jgi:adenine specific DNA methylase Mod
LTFGALKDNGSWYCWGIDEPLMDIYSNILKPMARENKITFRNLITWDKGNGQGQLAEDFRMYPIADEKCLFVMCGTMTTTSDECKGFENGLSTWFEGFEKFRAYFDEQAKKAGLTRPDIKKITNTYADHYFSKSQYAFPTKEHYSVIQYYCKKKGIEAFLWDYEEMRAEYLEQRNGKEYASVLAKQAEKRKEWYETRAYFDNTHDNMNNVWHFDRAGKDEREHTGGHATPKPIALCSRAIKSSSREGEVVLDVFGGSGSTLIACEQLNRKCYMCELDPHYIDVIIQRYINFKGTDKDVFLLRDGKKIPYNEVE